MQVRAETVVEGADLEVLHPLYLAAMAPLLTRAAARHVLTRAEFDEEMADRRITKVVVRDDEGRPCGLTTLTHDLTAVPWVNPSYFWSRFPDAVADGTLCYLGYIFVDPARRRSQALLLMASLIRRQLEEERAVIGFDTCAYNDERGIGRWAGWLFGPRSTVSGLDTQSYSVADFRHGRVPAEQPYPRQVPADDLRLVSLAERPDLADAIGELLSSRWPMFMLAGRPGHDEVLEALIGGALEHQVLAVDAEDRVRGVAFSLPIEWDGTTEDLPQGWDDAVTRAGQLQRSGRRPTAATALSVTVASDASRRGLAVRLVRALRETTARAGVSALIAPVRPVLKQQYPLVDMGEYLTWRTADGETFDPWVRTHLRFGARLLGVAPSSMTIRGTTEDWRGWVDDPLPGSGRYVVPGGLAPLAVRDGHGTYVEPNVWLVHDVVPQVV